MKVYLNRCQSARVGFTADDYATANNERHSPHLILYHLEDDLDQSLGKVLPALLEYKNAFVLCFKGSMLAGLSGHRQLMQEVQSRYGHRVHFLSFAVPQSGPTGKLLERMIGFAAQVEKSPSHVDWNWLDPEWQENLLAAYLAMRALAAAGRGSALEERLKPGGELQGILKSAEKEYQMLQGNPKATLGLEFVKFAKANQIAEQIWEQLRLLKI